MHMHSSSITSNLVQGISPPKPKRPTSFLLCSIHIQHHYYCWGCAWLYIILPWLQQAISLYIAYKIAHAIYYRHTCTGYPPKAAIQSYPTVPHTPQQPLQMQRYAHTILLTPSSTVSPISHSTDYGITSTLLRWMCTLFQRQNNACLPLSEILSEYCTLISSDQYPVNITAL